MATTDSRRRREQVAAGQRSQALGRSQASTISDFQSRASDYATADSQHVNLNEFLAQYLEPLLTARGENAAAYEQSHLRSLDHHKAAFDARLGTLADLERRARLGRFSDNPDEAQHWTGVLGSVPQVRSELSYRFEEQLQDELTEYAGFKNRQQQELLTDLGFFDTVSNYFSPAPAPPDIAPPEAPEPYEWQPSDASSEVRQWLGPVAEGDTGGPALYQVAGLTDANAAELVRGHLLTYSGTGDFTGLINNINTTIDQYGNPDNFVNPETGLPDGQAFAAAQQVAAQLRNTLNVLISSHQANEGTYATQQQEAYRAEQELFARQMAQHQQAAQMRRTDLNRALASLLGG